MPSNTSASSSSVRLKALMSPEVAGAKPTSKKPISSRRCRWMVTTSVVPRVRVTRAPTGRVLCPASSMRAFFATTS